MALVAGFLLSYNPLLLAYWDSGRGKRLRAWLLSFAEIIC